MPTDSNTFREARQRWEQHYRSLEVPDLISKSVGVIAGAAFLAGKGSKKLVDRLSDTSTVNIAATIIAESREHTEESVAHVNGSFLAAIGVGYERTDMSQQSDLDPVARSGDYPLVRLPNIASLSSAYVDEDFLAEAISLTDLPGVE